MLVEVPSDEGPIVFAGDLIPGAPWVHLPITMGYDRYPEALIDEKDALLRDLVERKRSTLLHPRPDDRHGAGRRRTSEADSRPARRGKIPYVYRSKNASLTRRDGVVHVKLRLRVQHLRG